MKKKVVIPIIIILIIGIFTSLTLYRMYREEQEKQELKAQARYNVIKESVKKAVEWNISAQYPKCEISKEFKETTSPGTFYNSKFLINNGYIKKDELLDIDNESYCDIFVDINTYYENPLDHQQNCEIYYKIYLKCKGYKDKGYQDWGL